MQAGGSAHLSGVDWTFVYQLLPALASVLLMLGSSVSSRAVRKRVNNLRGPDDDDKTFATNVALDWSMRLGFQASIVGAITAALAAFSSPTRPLFLAISILFLVMLWWMMGHYLWGEEIGEMVEGGNLEPALYCNLALFVVNASVAVIFCTGDDDCATALSWLFRNLFG